jgi:hypothetical protein
MQNFSWEGRCFEGLPEEPLLSFYLSVEGTIENLKRIIDGIKRLSWVRIVKADHFESRPEDPEWEGKPYASATLAIEERLGEDFIVLLKELGFKEI